MLLNDYIVNIISYSMICCGISAFIALQFLHAPYGRYYGIQWGPSLNGTMAWVLMELPALSITLVTYLYYRNTLDTQTTILFWCFIAHYFNRTFIFPLLIRGGKRSSLLAFLTALLFCIFNGTLQSSSLLLQNAHPSKQQSQLFFVVGIFTFFTGMVINVHSDHILRNLRKPGETGYKIPRGGMFEYVSAANFFGEVVEWSGFALAAGSMAAFTFAFFSACNLVPRGFSHHRWYKEKFEDYPPERRVIIPFVL